MARKRTTGGNAKRKMKRKAYEKELRELQVELCRLAGLGQGQGLRGSSSCSKGATPPARAAPSRPSPSASARGCSASSRCRRRPTAKRRRLFMQRYIEHFPAAGEVVIFDRSWYNRAGVEYVMGFCSEEQHERFLELCPEVEKYIVDGGITLIKIWLEVGKDEQERRFSARIDDPMRQWKLSPMDLESYRALVRLLAGARHDADANGQPARALVHRALGRQAAGAAQLHLPHPEAAFPTTRCRGRRSNCPSDRTSADTTIRRPSRA